MRAAGWLLGLFLIATCLPAPCSAGAQAPAEVPLRAAGVPAARVARALGVLVEERIRPLDVAAIALEDVLGPAAPDTPAVRLWVDGREASSLVLYVRAADRVLVRRVPRERHDDVAALEAAVQILGTALDAIRAGRAVGEERETVGESLGWSPPEPLESPPLEAPRDAPPLEAPPTAPVDAPEPPADASGSGLLGVITLGGFLRAFAPDAVPVAGGPFALGALLVPIASGLRLGPALEARYTVETALRGMPIEAVWSGLELRAALMVEGDAEDWLAWRAALTGGVDLAFVSPESRGDAVAAPPTVLVAPALGAWVAALARLTPFLAVELAAGLELDVSGQRWVWRDGDAVQVLLAPWPARPFVRLGLSLATAP